ncbi:hypothetical protein E2C01_010307 [Portunus trituberculatus]|uniref:Uncharacterized protein n=1 Tax=Portunus trituberculatus TaxID=210409 RepID=A0A5B7D893_PORTR|nr:hypothetical protein [Portunus trituberculatus]
MVLMTQSRCGGFDELVASVEVVRCSGVLLSVSVSLPLTQQSSNLTESSGRQCKGEQQGSNYPCKNCMNLLTFTTTPHTTGAHHDSV